MHLRRCLLSSQPPCVLAFDLHAAKRCGIVVTESCVCASGCAEIEAIQTMAKRLQLLLILALCVAVALATSVDKASGKDKKHPADGAATLVETQAQTAVGAAAAAEAHAATDDAVSKLRHRVHKKHDAHAKHEGAAHHAKKTAVHAASADEPPAVKFAAAPVESGETDTKTVTLSYYVFGLLALGCLVGGGFLGFCCARVCCARKAD